MGALEKNHFLLRKLHQLSGLLPVGFFLVEHMITNSQSLRGPAAYDEAVSIFDKLGPIVPVLELAILIPLFYHAFFGLWAAFIAKNTLPRYNYGRNWAFYAQRFSGVFTLLFVVYHLWEFRWFKLLGQLGLGPVVHINYEAVAAHLANPLLFAFYVLGIVGACYHFANGMWAFLIDFGFTVGPKAQRLSIAVWMVFFVLLSCVGVGAALGFRGAHVLAEKPASAAVTTP